MNSRYVITIKQDINKLLTTKFTQSIEEATWLSPIVVVPKKNGKLRICIDFKKLNAATKKDPCPLPFIDEVLNTIVGYEVCSFLDGYSKYHQISIAPDDIYKIVFVINWGVFIWKVMSFGVKNGLPTYRRAITKTFKKYLDNFMKIFLNDFTQCIVTWRVIYKSLNYVFQKCKEYGNSLNVDKCAFMVYLSMILGFIVSKEGKLPDPKKIQTKINMPPPKNPQQIQIFNGMA